MSIKSLQEALDELAGHADHPNAPGQLPMLLTRAAAELAAITDACVSFASIFQPGWLNLSDGERERAVATAESIARDALTSAKRPLDGREQRLMAWLSRPSAKGEGE